MLIAEGLRFGYRPDQPLIRGLDLTLKLGEIASISGPSGEGKSTLANLLAGYLAPQAGDIHVDGATFRPGVYRCVQLVHQNCERAVDPLWRIGDILETAYSPGAAERNLFGIEEGWLGRRAHELSAGQLQRVVLLRALSPQTRYLVADELSAMFDAISQARVWRALLALAAERNIGILVITHDAALARQIASTRLVMAGGRLVTSGAQARPAHRPVSISTGPSASCPRKAVMP